MPESPVAIMLAGPNGAGKTTTAMKLFKIEFRDVEYVNADVIAQGLSGGNPDAVALEAGKILLERLHALAEGRRNLAYETTGASKSFASWIKKLKTHGYAFRLYYFWLRSADAAIARVAERVRMGGHHVPDDTIRRRYDLGLRNFFKLYMPLATKWQLIDNNDVAGPLLIASGGEGLEDAVHNAILWNELVMRYGS